MTEHAHYIRIGVFVLLALTIAAVGVVVLGASALWSRGFPMETYMDESVQGLDVGSIVKYRGVKIGNIKEITFVRRYYNTEKNYVLIRANVEFELLKGASATSIQNVLERDVERGLRVRWTAQGITGAAYLEIDYLDPARHPTLPIDWEPESIYIPSTPSAFSRLTSTVEEVFQRIEKANIEAILDQVEILLTAATSALADAPLEQVFEDISTLIHDVRQTNQAAQDLLQGDAIRGILEKTDLTVASAHAFLEETRDSVRETMGQVSGLVTDSRITLTDTIGDIQSAAARVARLAETLDETMHSPEVRTGAENLLAISSDLTSTTAHLPETMARLNRTLRQTDYLLSSQQDKVDRILSELSRLSQNLADLSDLARHHPSWVLFGNPPKPSELTQ